MKSILLFSIFFANFAEALTVKDWKKLSANEKIVYMDTHTYDVQVSPETQKIDINLLNPSRQKILNPIIVQVTKQLKSYVSQVPTEVEDEYYATVGTLKTMTQLYFSEDNFFLGAYVHYSQSGCSHLDEDGSFIEQTGHYKNEQEARKQKCVDNDVSWSASSVADESLREIYASDFMEWSGH